MKLRDKLIDAVIEREGGYVDDARDSGGETNYGITAATARRSGYEGDMRELPIDTARAIYAARYWQPIKGHALAECGEALAARVFDTAVICGVSASGLMLQRALNVLRDGSTLPELALDGRIGPATLRMVRDYAARRDVAVLVKALNGLLAMRFISLAEKRPKDRRFVYGWLSHRVAL